MAFSRSVRRTSRWLALATAVASAATIAAAAGRLARCPRVGDPYFPQLGNGGFDALHYDLGVSYDPDTDRLDGRTTLTARATENLSAFDLDLHKLTVDSVRVNGQPRRVQQIRRRVADPAGLPAAARPPLHGHRLLRRCPRSRSAARSSSAPTTAG